MKAGAFHQGKNPDQLTEREEKVLALRNEKKTYKQIAAELGIGERTVDSILVKARAKMELR